MYIEYIQCFTCYKKVLISQEDLAILYLLNLHALEFSLKARMVARMRKIIKGKKDSVMVDLPRAA